MAIKKTSKKDKVFILPNKKVTLKPLVKNKTFMGVNNHDGLFMYTGTSRSWCIFRNSNGTYIDPLKTASERAFFEKEMGKDFNVHHDDNFWKDYTFKITKAVSDVKFLEKELDLSKPGDYLAWALLNTVPDVANNWKSRNKTPEYKWVLIEKDEDVQTKVTTGKQKSFCYNWVSDNEDKVKTLRDVLWLMGLNVSSSNTKNELLDNIYQLIEDNRLASKLYEELTAEDFNVKILFTKLIKGRYIIAKAGKYYDKDASLLAHNKPAILKWIANPENSLFVEQWKDEVNKLKF